MIINSVWCLLIAVKIKFIGINMKIEVNGRCECGFKYIKCEIDEREQIVEGMDVAELESNMERYCLMLPFVYSKEDFNQNFAIIYDNWQVGNELGGSEVPCICEWLFRQDVLEK